jgi:hypothetical protein
MIIEVIPETYSGTKAVDRMNSRLDYRRSTGLDLVA